MQAPKYFFPQEGKVFAALFHSTLYIVFNESANCVVTRIFLKLFHGSLDSGMLIDTEV